MWRRVGFYATILFCLLFIVGCWDNRDVTKINFVTAVGLDRTPEGKIEVTVEIPKSEHIKSAKGGVGGGWEKMVAVYTSTGDTVFEAIRKSLKNINEKLAWTQMGLIVVGEDLAKEGIMEVLDYFERDSEPIVTAMVLIARQGKAKEILELKSDLEHIPSVHLINAIEANRKAWGSACKVRLIDLLKRLHGTGINAALPVITLDTSAEKPDMRDIKLDGLALLKQDRLVGFLNSTQSKCWSIIKGESQSTIYNIPGPFEQDKLIVFEMEQAKAEKAVQMVDRQVRMTIDVQANGDIGETQDRGDFYQGQIIDQLEKEIAQVMRLEIEDAVEAAQQLQTDVFGFGDIFHKQNPKEWKLVKDEWDEFFSQGSLEVKVKVKIERSGYVNQPGK